MSDLSINQPIIPQTVGLNETISNPSKITIFGLVALFMYSVTKILNFYGIGIDVYGSYLAFYVFILFASFGLDKYYPKT